MFHPLFQLRRTPPGGYEDERRIARNWFYLINLNLKLISTYLPARVRSERKPCLLSVAVRLTPVVRILPSCRSTTDCSTVLPGGLVGLPEIRFFFIIPSYRFHNLRCVWVWRVFMQKKRQPIPARTGPPGKVVRPATAIGIAERKES